MARIWPSSIPGPSWPIARFVHHHCLEVIFAAEFKQRRSGTLKKKMFGVPLVCELAMTVPASRIDALDTITLTDSIPPVIEAIEGGYMLAMGSRHTAVPRETTDDS